MNSEWIILDSLRSLLKKNMQKLKSVFGLRRRVRIAYEPLPKIAQCDPKLKKKQHVLSKHIFASTTRKCVENNLQKVPKCGREFWWWRPKLSKVVPKVPKWCPKLPKVVPKVPKWWPSGGQVVPRWCPNGGQVVPKWCPKPHKAFLQISSGHFYLRNFAWVGIFRLGSEPLL